jgi:nanoRNase/pAp phosphatase (c-di-AMP/oligoRNAs hydrolase)
MVRLQGKTWSMCTGVFADRLYLSIRTTNSRADAGRLMRRLLGRKGKGGGHGMMAGGWIPLDQAGTPDLESLQNSLAARLAKYLKKNPERLAPLIDDS